MCNTAHIYIEIKAHLVFIFCSMEPNIVNTSYYKGVCACGILVSCDFTNGGGSSIVHGFPQICTLHNF